MQNKVKIPPHGDLKRGGGGNFFLLFQLVTLLPYHMWSIPNHNYENTYSMLGFFLSCNNVTKGQTPEFWP